jgi:hypothetical protein
MMASAAGFVNNPLEGDGRCEGAASVRAHRRWATAVRRPLPRHRPGPLTSISWLLGGPRWTGVGPFIPADSACFRADTAERPSSIVRPL